MLTSPKLAFGALLTIFGAAGMVLAPAFGVSHLPPPWSFMSGFIFGLLAGAGLALAFAGLIEKRRQDP